MSSSYEWVEHTGELELSVEGSSREEVCVTSALALGELLSEHEAEELREPGLERSAEVSASAPDAATLLAEWLSELVYHAEAGGLIPLAVERLELSDTALEATVTVRQGNPSHLVKAVTYHRLGLWSEDGTWHARVIFDV
jgi:SHS2 domain-containing protein